MKQFLEQTGLFTVDVQRTRYTWNGGALVNQYKIPGVPATTDLPKSKMDSSFHPNFAAYDVVICNFGWNAAPWPAETQADFDKFIKMEAASWSSMRRIIPSLNGLLTIR